jgi:hypothetical protein
MTSPHRRRTTPHTRVPVQPRCRTSARDGRQDDRRHPWPVTHLNGTVGHSAINERLTDRSPADTPADQRESIQMSVPPRTPAVDPRSHAGQRHVSSETFRGDAAAACPPTVAADDARDCGSRPRPMARHGWVGGTWPQVTLAASGTRHDSRNRGDRARRGNRGGALIDRRVILLVSATPTTTPTNSLGPSARHQPIRDQR